MLLIADLPSVHDGPLAVQVSDSPRLIPAQSSLLLLLRVPPDDGRATGASERPVADHLSIIATQS